MSTELVLPNGDVVPVRDRRVLAAEYRDPKAATRVVGWSRPGLPQIEEWDAERAFRLGYAINVVAYRCIQLRARAAAGVPLVAGTRLGDASTIRPNSRIGRLLGPPPGGPAPKMSARRLLRWTFAQKIVTGRRAWEIERDDNGVPVAFWPMVSADLRAVPARSGTEWFRVFHYGPAHDPIKLSPDEVFYGWEPSGLDFRKAESELQSCRLDLSLITLCDQHSIGFLRNNAVPAAIVTTSRFPDEASRRRFLQSWTSEFGGPHNAGRIALNELDDDGDGPVGDSIDIKVLGLSAKDARLMEQRKDLVAEVAIALGTPFSKLDASGRTFDNASQEDLDWWENTVLPDMIDLQDDINMQLAPLLGDEVVWFDLREVRALQRRHVPLTQTVGAPQLLRWRVLTINEARADYGLPPIPGGDRFLTDEEIQLFSGAQGGADEAARALLATIEERTAALEQRSAEPPAEPPPAPEQREGPTPDEVEARRARIWRAADAQVRTLEARWERAVGRLFTRQEEATLARLRGKRGRQLLAAAAERRDGEPIDAADIFDAVFWTAASTEMALDLYEQVAAASGGQLAAQFEVAFDVSAQWVRDFIEERANQLAGQITTTTYEAIQAQLVEGVLAGESIDDLATRIRTLFAQTYAGRARTVARTEVISAYNGAAALGAAQLPADVVAAQEWIATRDGRVRPAHAAADGQIVAVGTAFDVGGATLAYPGDPAGGARNTVNCRCTIAFLTPAEWAEMAGRARPGVERRVAGLAVRMIEPGDDFDEMRFRRALEVAAA